MNVKKFRNLTSILVTIIMVACFSFTAFAADQGSITIEDSGTVSVAEKTFAAYKILDVKFANGKDSTDGLAYTVVDAMKSFFETRYSLTSTEVTFDEDVVAEIAKESDLQQFSKDVLKAAKTANIVPVKATAPPSVKSVVIDSLPLGYYVIEDEGTKTPISALMLDTTDANKKITLKADQPDIKKKIDGDTDLDDGTSGMVDMNKGAIGDKVPYVLTSKVPDMTGYTKYFFIAHDTLSKGLKYLDDMKISVDNVVLAADTDYTVNKTDNGDGTTTIEVIFKDFYNKYKNKQGTEIKITYSAEIIDDAKIGNEGNVNEVVLEYSNNPNITPNGTDAPDSGDNVTGKTPKKIVKTFVTGIKITKTNESGDRLTGAEFKLSGDKLNTVMVSEETYVQDNVSGDYYKLKNNTYTKTKPTEDTKNQYESITDKYKMQVNLKKQDKATYQDKMGVVDSKGELSFLGVTAGSYELTETKAPDGYNILRKPIAITITCKLPASVEGECTWTATDGTTDKNGDLVNFVKGGVVDMTIENSTGTILPSTGGIGTTIFYVIGGILVVSAVVLLIVKKRMSSDR